MTTPAADERKVVRGGNPGKYFLYRENEILVEGSDEQKVAAALGADLPPKPESSLDDDERSAQRFKKQVAVNKPFGIWLTRLPEGMSSTDALTKLAAANIVADFNYVSSRAPMRSHAVSYAEPADPALLPPLEPAREKTLKVGVLDTGRPYYADAFRSYVKKRFGVRQHDDGRQRMGQYAAGGHQTNGANREINPSIMLDEADSIFEPTGNGKRKLPGTETSSATTEHPEPDRDTMVAPMGRLTHPHAGHGMFVSSIIARHAPGVTIIPEATAYEDGIADLYEILLDLKHALDRKCQLINISLGFRTRDDKSSPLLDLAIQALEKRNVLIVASAGNDASVRKVWPAAHDDVVAVAATNVKIEREPADWSNYGDWVDACALGEDVIAHYVFADWDFPDGSAKRFRGAAQWSGTSFSAPLVTAMIAKEMIVNQHPTPRAAWEALEAVGVKVKKYGVFISPETTGVAPAP